jgi:hypothetical protein
MSEPMMLIARPLISILALVGVARPALPPPSPATTAAATPAALRDGAERAGTRRVRIARIGAVRFERTDPLDQRDGGDDRGDVGPDSPARLVADTSPTRVQVRSDDDDARLLVWLDRADLVPVVVTSHALRGAIGADGVIVRAGAPVSVVGGGASGERTIVVDDHVVRVRGVVPRDAIGDVYDQPAPRVVAHTRQLAAGHAIRVSPDVSAAVIASTVDAVGVRTLGPAHGDWIEIELDRDWMYVRGFVRAADVAPGDAGATFSVGGSSGYGMSDTDRLIVPAGACLYARPGGPIIGVTTTEQERYGGAIQGAAPGWWQVTVGTTWGVLWPAVHVSMKAGKPTADADRCATGP